MKNKIFLLFTLLSLAAVITTTSVISIAAYNKNFDAVKKEVAENAKYIAAGAGQNGSEYLASLPKSSTHRVTLISAGGEVLFDSRSNASQMENHRERPEVIAALELGAGEATRRSATLKTTEYYYALRLNNGDVIRLACETRSIGDSFNEFFIIAAAIAIAVLIISALLASKLTKSIIAPINNINLENPEKSKVYDELAPLVLRIKQQHMQIVKQMSRQKRAQTEFSLITSNMREGFLVLGSDGCVLSYNKSALKLLDSKISDASGRTALVLNRNGKFRTLLQNAFLGEKQSEVIRISHREILVTANPVVEDEVKGFVVVLFDITEKQEREKLRREFTANVSHELKTPLTSISGYAELMAAGVARPEDTKEFAERILTEAKNLVALIHDLMLLSKLEEAPPMQMQQVSLLSVCNNVKYRLEQKAAEKELTLSITGEDAELLGIPAVIEEMVFNLCDNAIKYNKQGGSVEVSILKEEACINLCVADTGGGIPAAEKERIFERFYRIDKSRNSTVPGTGLGLAIVKHGAMLHNAKVDVKSDANGSSFIVSFRL
ncbi:MAG: hypothetical protein LBS74_04890 [Oscillospiraceae bacterium]|nr:hypothetical protein [Oscillospiraceae bacterium]